MAIPDVKWERYTPDSPDLKNRTSYKGTLSRVKAKVRNNREKVRTYCRINKLSLKQSQTRSSE
jgi:hypothetical protein